MKQTTNKILMIRPARFFGNPETAVNNYYQCQNGDENPDEINQKAIAEFDSLVEKLKSVDIEIIQLQDSETPSTPDSIFPNNWFSTKRDGTLIYYPMFAENRRKERRPNFVNELIDNNCIVKNQIDLSYFETSNIFLEGTGSIIFDHESNLAYCALSPRADEKLFRELCEMIQYEPICFHAFQSVEEKRELIYHTNVMMSIGSNYCVICLDSIDNLSERGFVKEKLQSTGKEIIEISEDQTEQFAGNILSLNNRIEEIIAMSSQAYNAFSYEQIQRLASYGKIVHSPIPTIEKYGGGSVRCMIAEIFN